VDLVAIGNRTVSRAEQRREQFFPEARVYSDLGEMLAAEELDFIDILTIPSLHREHCLMAAEKNLHIVCQKPLCDSLEDAASLAQRFTGYPRIFAVHENHRYRPWFQRVAAALRDDVFGAPRYLEIRHINATYPKEAYKTEVELGVFFEYGSHLVDMMRCLLGDPSRVHARFERPTAQVSGESLAQALYEYPGASASITAGWKDGAITQGSLLLVGEKGEAYYEGTLTRGGAGRLRILAGRQVLVDEPVDPTEAYVESFYLLERECAGAMRGEGPVTQTAAEHLGSLKATFAAYDSVRLSRAVPVK
jgi:predicted dehydrogenase